ncbi:MAG: SusC/RagA family TonB-linked outer membrane protein [Bacteroidales bacterium]|nr:SusC/RagA family TonB-linked outer membrane protein [Bacteroidales bacterium]
MEIKFKRTLSCLVVLLAYILVPANLLAQTVNVSGVVTDAKTNEPVVGAALMVKGTTRGTSSNDDGSYSLRAAKGDVIICQFFGYKTVEAEVGTGSVINFALQEDTQTLDQSVVVGYGTLKKTQLVGSVENLEGEKLTDRSNVNVARSLQGQIAGLNIVQTDGKVSHSGNVYIRTNNHTYLTRASMTDGAGAAHTIGQGGGGALVLIDGVEGSLSNVNPSDIETVAVLKDASSASIYGAKAYNGVILVTTKDAKSDKFTISYNGAYSYNDRAIKWEDNIITDPVTWTESFYEFVAGDKMTPTAAGNAPSTVNTFTIGSDYLERLKARREAGNYDIYDTYNGAYAYYGETNWLKLFYKPNTTSQTHDISVRGSSKKLSYAITGRYYTQEGLYKVGDDDYDQFNIRAKGTLKVYDWLSFDNNTSVFHTNQQQSMFTTGSILGKQIEQHGQPILVPYNENGTYTLAAAKTGYASFTDGNTGQVEENLTLVTTTGVNLTIVKDVLKFRGDYSYKAIRRARERYRAPLTFWLSDNSYTEYVPQASSYKSRWTYDTNYMTANAYFTFTPKLGENHELNVVAGGNLEDYQYDRFYIQRKGMLIPDKWRSYELFDGTDYTIEQNDSSYGVIGFFGRANYTLLRRYIFEVAARYDGSSKFPETQKWGFFPSASVGWRLSEEPFMRWSKSWLDNFKIRANIGSLGNGTVSPYTYLETIGVDKTGVIFDGQKNNYTTVPSPVPAGLTWETVTTYDLGVDIDILRSRLSFSGDIFKKISENVITAGPQLPDVYGASAPKGNYASYKDLGWEATLSWRDSFKLGGKDFNYSIKGSVWDTRTIIIDYTNLDGNLFSLYSGKHLGEIWGFRTDGIFRDNVEANNWATDTYHKNGSNFREYAGDLKFIDVDGDGDINYGKGNLEDHGDIEVIGNETPRYQFGLNLDFNWNGFGVNVFFQGVGKRDWYPTVETGFFWGPYNRQYSPYLMHTMYDRMARVDFSTENWVVTNYDDNPYWTRPVAYAANRNVGPLTWQNDHYLQNAAYVRLKTLNINYTLPKKLTRKVKLENVKFYVNMENLWTWSPMFKYTDMFDPEGIGIGDTDFDSGSLSGSNYGLSGVGEGYGYPMMRTFTFGVNLTL